jgi:hypothetical protein
MAFSGTHSGLSACNDAAYFGGPSQALFQGYGSTIDHVFFDKIREWAYLGYGANGLVIENNTSSTSGGNSSTDGSAIEANTTYGSGNTNTNNIIQNNTFEATFYEHFVKCNTCYRNSFLTNGAFDTGSTWLSTYLMSDGGLGYSFILEGLTASGVLVTGTDTSNTIISMGGNGFNSYFPNASVFEKGVSSVNGTGAHEWQITNQATSDSWWWQQTVPVNTQSYELFDTPAGGAQINAMSVQHYGSDIYGIELNSTIESFFECPNGTCIVRSQGGSGQVQLNDGYVYVSSRVMNAPTFNATTAYKMNTNTILPSILNGYHGSGAGDVKTQLSDGTGISGHVAAFDATGGLTDGGSGGTVSSASLATTAAASNMVTIPGATSSSHCSLTPTNSGAALDLGAGTAYVSTKATNSITVTHAAVASETFDLMCTSN